MRNISTGSASGDIRASSANISALCPARVCSTCFAENPDMSLYPQSVSIFAASSKDGASIMRSALSRVSIFASLALSIAERYRYFSLTHFLFDNSFPPFSGYAAPEHHSNSAAATSVERPLRHWRMSASMLQFVSMPPKRTITPPEISAVSSLRVSLPGMPFA